MPFLAPILGFFGTTIGKWLAIAGLAAVTAGLLMGIYFSWRSDIQANATLRYEKAQLEQNLKDAKDEINTRIEVGRIQALVTMSMDTNNEEIEADTQKIIAYIESPEAQKSDRDSSLVLKEVFRRIK